LDLTMSLTVMIEVHSHINRNKSIFQDFEKFLMFS